MASIPMRTLMIKFLTLSVPLLLWSIGCGSEGPGSSAARDRAVQQLGVAVARNNEATAFSNQLGSTGSISDPDFQPLRALWSNALVEARKIDIEALNAEDPGFGNIVRDKFIRGLELCTQSTESDGFAQGQLLLYSFGDDFAKVKAKKRRGSR